MLSCGHRGVNIFVLGLPPDGANISSPSIVE
jgi:hypothetical protein